LLLTVFTQRNFVGDFFSSKVRRYLENGRFAFLSPGVSRNVQCLSLLIGKRVVDFLLVLIELFARCYRWGATSEYRLKIGDFASTGASWPIISGKMGCPHYPFFFL